MEPDPSSDSSNIPHSDDTQITSTDINAMFGVSKKRAKKPVLYFFSKKVIIAVAVITTFIYLGFHYLGLV